MKKYTQEHYIKMMGLEGLVKKTGDKFNFRCCYCGDGKSGRKKRGWLNWNQSYDTHTFHCFNCDHSTNFYGVLTFQAPHLVDDYNKEIKEDTLNNFGKKKTVSKIINFSGFDLPQGVIPCSDSKVCLEYVKMRQVPEKYYKDWKFVNKSVLIPFYREDELFGYQTRSLEGKYFNITLDNDEYKIWNYDKVDKSKDIYFFESIFDAAIFDGQSVSLVGRTIPDELEFDIIELGDRAHFIFDNDEAGLKSTDKYSKLYPNANFILWDPKIKFKDYGEVRENISKEKTDKWLKSAFVSGNKFQLLNKLTL